MLADLSAREPAFIFRITLPRCAFTVISLMPSSRPTCFIQQAGDDQRHDLPFAAAEGRVIVPERPYLRLFSLAPFLWPAVAYGIPSSICNGVSVCSIAAAASPMASKVLMACGS